MLNIRKILYPTDFSEPAAAAFPLAVALARDYGATLIVLYADPPPTSHGEVVARRQDTTDGLWRLLHEIQAPSASIRVEHRLEEGEAAEVILRAAREHQVDMIVMGTHGRTGLRRLLMGSVAEQVLRRAPCLVLTARQPAAGEQ